MPLLRTAGVLVIGSLFAVAAAIVAPSARANETPSSDATAPAFKAQLKREWTWGSSDSKWNAIQSQLGKPAPALTVGPWTNGEADLDKLKGKIVLVQFWATWCGPCRAAVPATNQLMQEHASNGVAVVGICCTREGKGGTMAQAVEKTGMKYPTAQDKDDATATAWGTQWWPYYVVIDRQGVIRGAGLTPDGAKEFLKDLLKEQPGA